MKSNLRGRLVALTAALLLLAAISDVQQGWLAVGVSAAAVIPLTFAFPQRHRMAVAIGNLAACALLAWSLTERVGMSVTVEGDRLQARAGGELVQARDARYAEGGASVWQEGSRASRPVLAIPDRLLSAPWLDMLLAPAYDGFRSGIGDITVRADGSTQSVASPFWQLTEPAAEPIADGTIRSISVEVQALRPLTPFAVLARFSGGEGYQVLVRPESRDLSISRVRDGRLVQELENRGSPFRKDWVAALQSVVRELGRTWLFALLLVVVGAIVTPARHMARSNETIPNREGSTSRARTFLALATLSVLAMAATGWIAVNVFESVPHDRDSVAYLFQSRVFASGRVSVPAPELPEFFKEDFIVQHQGRWFGKYPPGHPLVLAIGVLAGVPWLVGPVLAGAAVALLGVLGRRLFGSGLGVLAAVLLLTSPFFLFMSGSFLAHPTALVLTLGALCLGARLTWGASGTRAGVLLGLALGALLCTRQLTGATLAVCLCAWIAMDPVRPVVERLKLLAALGLGAAPPVLGLLSFQWATTGSVLLSPQLLWWSFDTIGFGRGVGADGWHDPSMGLHDTWDRLTELQRHVFGWPFYLSLAPAMVPFIAGRAQRKDWWLLSIAATLVIGYVLYWNRGMAYGPRYYYEALGPICLLTARGFQVLSSLMSSGQSRFGVAYGGGVAFALVAFNVGMYLPQQVGEFRGYLGVDGRRVAHVRGAGLDHGLIFVRDEPRGSWQPYASVFWMNAPTLDARIVYARDRGAEENSRLRALYPDRPAYLLTQSGLAPMSSGS